MANRGAFMGGLAIGAIAGATVTWLASPRNGRENRRILQKSARALPELTVDLASSVQLQADRAAVGAGHRCGQAIARLRQAIAVGMAATQLELEETPDSEVASGAELSAAGTRVIAEQS